MSREELLVQIKARLADKKRAAEKEEAERVRKYREDRRQKLIDGELGPLPGRCLCDDCLNAILDLQPHRHGQGF